MATYTPPAPHLDGDARLDVFAHRSIAGPLHEPYGDGNRLAALGRAMLEAAYRDALIRARPDVRREAFKQYVDATYPNFIARWVERYQWRQMIYGVPAGVDLNDPLETAHIFEAYAGAVVAQANLGHVALFRWIADLVNVQ
ncbi:hypothetical protein C8Q80DRAFT_1113913 [Daedaleopsis nitida]|nr:hypothetical protein C8Q80DRAFT_1113913 [Daedaleopsis nitida]